MSRDADRSKKLRTLLVGLCSGAKVGDGDLHRAFDRVEELAYSPELIVPLQHRERAIVVIEGLRFCPTLISGWWLTLRY
jgi:hypothetical protein